MNMSDIREIPDKIITEDEFRALQSRDDSVTMEVFDENYKLDTIIITLKCDRTVILGYCLVDHAFVDGVDKEIRKYFSYSDSE